MGVWVVAEEYSYYMGDGCWETGLRGDSYKGAFQGWDGRGEKYKGAPLHVLKLN